MTDEKYEELNIYRAGCSFYCRIRGQGSPLLLVHGVATDADYFEETAKILSNYFKVITYDRRGHNRSIIDEGIWETAKSCSVSEQAKDALEIINKIAGGNAIVCGCSAGGLVALKLAADYPKAVSKLFLYEAAYAVETETLEKIAERQATLEEMAAKGNIAKCMLYFMEAVGERDPQAKETSPAKMCDNITSFRRFLNLEIKEFLEFPAKNQDIVPQMPCICGVGSMDEGQLFYRTLEGSSKKWNVPLSKIEGCHNLAYDRPETFADWIKNSL